MRIGEIIRHLEVRPNILPERMPENRPSEVPEKPELVPANAPD
jgi:hypothetical protein